MSFHELTLKRHSLRDFDSTKPVSRSLLLSILETARHAPSARNRQPWRVVVVESPDQRQALGKAFNREAFLAAPVVLAIWGERPDPEGEDARFGKYLETDLSIFITHLLLAATEIGIGSCWVGAFDAAEAAKALGFEGRKEVVALIPLGYPTGAAVQLPAKNRHPLEELVSFV